MIHLASTQSRPAVIVVEFKVLGWTDHMYENGDHYRPGTVVGLVDQ